MAIRGGCSLAPLAPHPGLFVTEVRRALSSVCCWCGRCLGGCGGGLLYGNGGANRSAYALYNAFDWLGFTGSTQVEVRGRTVPIPGLDATLPNPNEDVPGVVLRASVDRTSAIVVEVQHGSETTKYMGKSNTDCYSHIRFFGIANGARFLLGEDLASSNATHMPLFRGDQWQRWEDNNASLATMTATLKIGGAAFKTWTLSALPGWATFFAALSASHKAQLEPAGVGTGTGNRRRGSTVNAAFPPYSFTWGVRVVDPSTDDDLAGSTGSYGSSIVVVTDGQSFVGSAAGGRLEYLTAGGPVNAGVSSVIHRGAVLAADGTRLWRLPLGPQGVAASAWQAPAAVAGTLPQSPRLLAVFQDSVWVSLGGQNSTNYIATRTGTSLDFDVGADPFPTAAFAGVNGPEGLPAQPITALIPAWEDYMLIAGPRSLVQWNGDPRRGGTLTTRSVNVGCLNGRCWCFDDRGALYVLCQDGLYKLGPDGAPPTPVSAGRLPGVLDQIDASAVYAQMVYNRRDRLVHIYRSPVNKAAPGVHVVYDVERNAFFEDEFGTGELDPWAVAAGDDSNPDRSLLLIGGQDGFVRVLRPAALADDSSGAGQLAITASVDVLIPDGGGIVDTMIEELHVRTKPGTGPVNGYWFTAPSPAQVSALTPPAHVAALSIAPDASGSQRPILLRRTGEAHKLRLEHAGTATSFAVESMQMRVSPRGRRRR